VGEEGFVVVWGGMAGGALGVEGAVEMERVRVVSGRRRRVRRQRVQRDMDMAR
jgi:hypothetical protein